MTPLELQCLDYEGTDSGRVGVNLGEYPKYHTGTLDHIRLNVKDLDSPTCGSIVYLNVEQAQAVVIALVTAIKEIKHGPQD